MGGTKLIKQVTEATGLPDHLVEGELLMLIEKSGMKAQDLTLDDLRQILASYLQDILVEAKENLNSPTP